MKIRGAIFDMDGLMFDTERMFLQAFQEAVAPQMGHPFPPEQLKRLIGRTRPDVRRLFEEMFPQDDFDTCFGIHRLWANAHIQQHGLPIKPGLFQLLEHLKRIHCPIAVASSTRSDLVRHYMDISGALPYLSVIIGGDMVENGKPNPEIFLKAAQALGRMPQDCMVFEDSKNGLLAAARGGFPCIVVPDLMDPTEEYPGLCYAKIESLDQAVALIETEWSESEKIHEQS